MYSKNLFHAFINLLVSNSILNFLINVDKFGNALTGGNYQASLSGTDRTLFEKIITMYRTYVWVHVRDTYLLFHNLLRSGTDKPALVEPLSPAKASRARVRSALVDSIGEGLRL